MNGYAKPTIIWDTGKLHVLASRAYSTLYIVEMMVAEESSYSGNAARRRCGCTLQDHAKHARDMLTHTKCQDRSN